MEETKRYIRCELDSGIRENPENIGFDAAQTSGGGHTSERASSQWLATEPSIGVTELSVPIDRTDRRHVVGIVLNNAAVFTILESGQGGFAWAGGTPAVDVDLNDYPDGVFRASHVVGVSISRMLVMTHRLPVPNFDWNIGIGSVRNTFFLEGELESEVGIWKGKPSVT